MSKKIEWLDNFAEKYAKEMKKTASKIEKQDLIVDPSVIRKNSKVGDLVKFKGKLYKVADLDFTDEVGPGVILSEVGTEVPTGDPMSMAMGTEVNGLEQKCTTEPERARTNPGDIYDLGDIRQQEVDDASAAAQRTESDIAGENSVNRTTVDGKYSNPTDSHGFVDQTMTNEIPVEDVVEDVVEEDFSEEEFSEDVCDCEEDETCEDCEEDESFEELDDEKEVELIATRTNRILRRIMASKRR